MNEKIKSISILNTIGQSQMVTPSFPRNGETIELNISLLSSGIYYLEIFTEKEKIGKIFVKD